MKIYLPGFSLSGDFDREHAFDFGGTNSKMEQVERRFEGPKVSRIWFCNHLQRDLGEIYDLFAILPASFGFVRREGVQQCTLKLISSSRSLEKHCIRFGANVIKSFIGWNLLVPTKSIEQLF